MNSLADFPDSFTGARDSEYFTADLVSLVYYVLHAVAFLSTSHQVRSVAVVVSCYCFIIVAAVFVVGLGALFLLFVLLPSQRVASYSYVTLGELLHDPSK